MTFKEFCQATFIIVFLVGVGVWGGYSYRDYQVAEAELNNEKLISVAKDAYQEGLVKDVLAKNKHTKEVLTYEKTKPEFYNVCVTDNYVRVFNEQSEQYIQKLPSK